METGESAQTLSALTRLQARLAEGGGRCHALGDLASLSGDGALGSLSDFQATHPLLQRAELLSEGWRNRLASGEVALQRRALQRLERLNRLLAPKVLLDDRGAAALEVYVQLGDALDRARLTELRDGLLLGGDQLHELKKPDVGARQARSGQKCGAGCSVGHGFRHV